MDYEQLGLAIDQDMDAVRADFYDGLFVQSLLQHDMTSHANPTATGLHYTPQDVRSDWHRFLDGLCFLCDSRCGGKSVVALVAEWSLGETIFWIKTDSAYQEDAADHLSTVLDQLRESAHLDIDMSYSVAEDIAQRSIVRSTQRVYNYRKRLSNLVLNTSQSQINASAAAVTLQQDLKGLIAAKKDYTCLCRQSYNFRYQAAYGTLKEVIADSSEDVWIRIRHFIGRLGQWHRVARLLAKEAKSFGSALKKYQVASIPHPKLGPQSSLTLDEDIRNLALRVFPNFRGTSLCDKLVDSMSRSEKLLEWFRSNDLVPRPHAEVVALEFAYSRAMEMVNDDRYIGCSKSSCYCCSLYMQSHPGGYRPRPTHGNVWVQWCLPRSYDPVHTDFMSLSILRRMADETRNLAEAVLTNGHAALGRKFDSTTGISSSVVAFT